MNLGPCIRPVKFERGPLDGLVDLVPATAQSLFDPNTGAGYAYHPELSRERKRETWLLVDEEALKQMIKATQKAKRHGL